MNLAKTIKQGMLDNDISGIISLCEVSCINYRDVSKMLKNDSSVKLARVVQVLDCLNIKIKFVIKGV